MKCVNYLINSDQFISVMRQHQFGSAPNKSNIGKPMQLLTKLNSFITEIYISCIQNIIPSHTLKPYKQDYEEKTEECDDQQQQRKTANPLQTISSKDINPTKVMVISEIFQLFGTFVIFISKHNFIDKQKQYNHYKQTLHHILKCIINELNIDPTHCSSSMIDAIRLQSSLQCLYQIITCCKSVTSNQLFVNEYDNVFKSLLNIASRQKKSPNFPALTPNSFQFKHDYRLTLCCLDFMLERFISGIKC